MPLSANHIHFFVSYAVAFVVFGLIGKWYLWPAIKERAPAIALTPLPLYACLRVNGLIPDAGAGLATAAAGLPRGEAEYYLQRTPASARANEMSRTETA